MDIPLPKIIKGIILGLIVAFSFYGFFYTMREMLRIFTINHHDILVLSDSEVHFYNLIYAYISLILGQSFCFLYWFDMPHRAFLKKNRYRTMFLNDQRVLNWYFLSWFSKMAMASVFFIFASSYYVISLYPEFNFLFILLVVVLFLQTWNTIRRVYKNKSLKWLLISAFIISILAFGISRINFVNYKAFNNVVLSGNPMTKYQIHLPHSFEVNRTEDNFLIQNIFIGAPHDSLKHPFVYVNDKEIAIEELRDEINKSRAFIPDFKLRRAYCRLIVDKRVKMKTVDYVKKEIAEVGVRYITYGVLPKKVVYDEKFYNLESFKMRNLDVHLYHADMPPPNYTPFKRLYNDINIKVLNTDSTWVNAYKIRNDSLVNSLFQLLNYNHKSRMVFYYDSTLCFSEYYKIIDASKAAVNQLRNKKSMENYGLPFDEIDLELQKDLKREYPWKLVERDLE